MKKLLLLSVLSLLFNSVFAQKTVRKPNVIFILADDHRHDFMSFMPNRVPWLKTPNLDRIAREGTHCQNAFVTTALCSPSRASILTGLYTHLHKVVDNMAPEPKGLTYFPQYLQQAGYQTAFFGKWHMGDEGDHPRPGFHQWVSFKGQGVYYNPTLNVNGKQVAHKDSAYISDVPNATKTSRFLSICRTRRFMPSFGPIARTGASTNGRKSTIPHRSR